MFIWAPPWAGFKNWILEVLELVWLARFSSAGKTICVVLASLGPVGASCADRLDSSLLWSFRVDALNEPGGIGIGPVRMLPLEVDAYLLSGVIE
jgi:hypothetical protein